MPTRRVIILGASNVTRDLGTVVATALGVWRGPLDIMAAIGHGRSYGATSNVLGRRLPGILECGLWKAVAERPPLPTAALVTDIGNDVLYGVPVEQIAAWIEETIDRLQSLDARIVMTRLPLCNLGTLSQRRFLFFRSLFVPSCKLSLAEARSRACQLDEQVERIGRAHGITLVEQQSAWYGLDPIHIRLDRASRVWREILAHWLDEEQQITKGRLPLWPALRLRLLAPQERQLWFYQQRTAQPSGQLPNGTLISLY